MNNSTYNIERTILSTILFCDLNNKDDFQEIAFFEISPEVFQDKIHQYFAKAIVELQKKDVPPTDIIVSDALKLNQQSQTIQESWLLVLEATPTTLQSLKYLYGKLVEKYEKRILGALKW